MAGLWSEVAYPRIQKFASEAFNARMFGFFCYRAWIYTLFFTPALLVTGGSAASAILNGGSRVALIITLILFGPIFKGATDWILEHRMAYLPALFCIAGSALVPLGNLTEGTLGMLLLVGGSALTGVGSGFLILIWGKVYGSIGGGVVAAETALAFMLASLVIPAGIAMPFWLEMGLVVIFPILSVFLGSRELVSLGKECADTEEESAAPAAPDMDHNTAKRLLVKTSVVALVFSLVLSVLRAAFNQQYYGSPEFDSFLATTGSAIIGALIVLAVLMLSRRLDLAFSYKPVLWLVVLGCFLMSLLDEASIWPYFFARCGFISFTILTWVMLSDLSVKSDLGYATVFGVGQAAYSLGSQFGGMINESGLVSSLAIQHGGAVLSGLFILVLIALYTFVLTERDVSHMLVAPETKAQTDETPTNDAGMEPVDDRDIISAIGQKHGLGERACEVMYLYARGRSRTRIEQELFMSAGTVNFHLRNIYAALDVHSKQELMDFVERESQELDRL